MSKYEFDNFAISKPKKKRHRISLSCLFCKKRKVKCDKGNPCSSCTKSSVECVYESKDSRPPIRPAKASSQDDLNRSLSHSSSEDKSSSFINPNLDNSSESLLATNSAVYDELKILKRKLVSLENSFKTNKTSPRPTLSNTTTSTSNIPTTSSNNSGLTSSSIPIPGPPSVPFSDVPHGCERLFGTNPVASEDDCYNFYTNECPVISANSKRKNFGPLSWVSLLQTDLALNKLWHHMLKVKQQQKSALFTVEKRDTDYFQRQVQSTDGFSDDMKPYTAKNYHSTSHRVIDTSTAKNKINARAMSLGLMFYEGGIDEELALIDKIELVLPKKKVIWKLIARFFSHIYPYFPFLDENDFRTNVARFIGPESFEDEKVTDLRIDRKFDFTYLGTLLLVLRFSYLTLFTNSATVNEANLSSSDPSPKAQEIKYLLNNVISIDAVDVSLMCLQQFNLVKTLALPLLQLALLTRVYRIYSPEDGEGRDNTNSVLFTGTLIQMANSMGLNREPDLFPKEHPDPKVNNLCRKIWYYLIVIDVNDALMNGTPVLTHPETFDTKAPYHQPGNENVRDGNLDQMTAKQYGRTAVGLEITRDLMDMIVSLKKKVNLSEFCAKLSSYESYLIGNFGESLSLHVKEDTLNKESVFAKGIKIKVFLLANFFFCSIYLHLFNYYDAKGDKIHSFFYMKKMIFICILNCLPLYADLIDRSPYIFRNSTDLFMTPAFEAHIHKTIIVLHSLYMRARFSLLHFTRSSDHLYRMEVDSNYHQHVKSIEVLMKLIWRCLSVLLDTAATLSNRYYYSWRIVKACSFLHKYIDDDELYQFYADDPVLLNFSTSMIDELNDIMKVAIKKIAERKRENVKVHTAFNDFNSASTAPKPKPTPSTATNLSTTRTNSTTGFSATHDQPHSYATTGEPHSVESSNSTETNEFFNQCFNPQTTGATNPQIDDLWIQMMTVKDDLRFPYKISGGFNVESPMVNPTGPNNNFAGVAMDESSAGPATLDFSGINSFPSASEEIFDRMAFDDFFHDGGSS